MNMFKSRRKAKEQSDALDILTGGQSPPAMHKGVKYVKRKDKLLPEDPRPMFDLSTALPDSNDFRTSLLMPKLSARFSMLREQDDPNTKLGKASDDSVLSPKRASRMNWLNNNALADVAEDDRETSTFRPPFAERHRSNSTGEGCESDSGSIMNRSRPVEGNTLFGGRQKFIKVPTSLANSVVGGDLNPTVTPDNEPPVLPPTQWRIRTREAQLFEEVTRDGVVVTDGGDSSEIASPATVFSRNRGTQSSTNSVPRRTSTAATSVASESPACRDSAGESIAANSADVISAAAPESQPTTSASKPRDDPVLNRFLSQSKGRAGERGARPTPIFSSTSFRNANSPASQVSQPLDFGFKTDSRSTSVTGRYQTDSPTPSQVSLTDDMLASNVQPNDRGKATAMGLFNKPAREFDEYQFNQRQIKMHEEQVSSMSINSRSTSRASSEVQKVTSGLDTRASRSSSISDDQISIPQNPPVPATPESPVRVKPRPSKASRRSPPLRPRSKSAASATATAHVKARVESLIRKQNAELAALEAEKLGTPEPKLPHDMTENQIENREDQAFSKHGAVDDDDASDYGDPNGLDTMPTDSNGVDESHIHPAFRNSHRTSEVQSYQSRYSNFSRTKSVVSDEQHDSFWLPVPSIESEFIDQQPGIGLSGLIRTHLRHDSDRSSIWPRPESNVIPTPVEASRVGSIASMSRTVDVGSRSDLGDLDVARRPSDFRASQAPPTPTTVMSQTAQQFLSQAMAMRNTADGEKVGTSSGAAPQEDDPADEKTWHDELEPKHHRGGSSETTKERRAFDEDLAARRQKIREGLKSVAERDRSQSPATAHTGSSMAMQAFVQQRAVADAQPKALKMLGLQSRVGSSGVADDDRGRNTSSPGEPRGRTLENAFSKQQTATYARFGPEPIVEPRRPAGSTTPPAVGHNTRDRSSSNRDDRSKSRPRAREVNLPPAHPHGHDGDGSTNWNLPPMSPFDHQLPDHFSAAAMEPTEPRRRGHKLPLESTTRFPVRPAPRPSPVSSPQASYESTTTEANHVSSGPHATGGIVSGSDRSTPTSNAFNRKRSVTKTMISEPKFVSSTSSVPLVHLPQAQQTPPMSVPPLPLMNPRRRGNTTGEKPVLSPVSVAFSARSTPLEPVPASPLIADFGTDHELQTTSSPSPRKLRKATSEGGSMAAKARHQAMAAELSREKARSPPLPVFPNRSATALVMAGDGGMF